ncbi:MAG TPA: endonuclease MutS2 [Candidatus Methanoperedens sp.]|nr:endonuclease MutS2 [Candidatus Methanoperedens sp.]
MDSHSLAVLEYRRVVDLVREGVPSSLGAAALAAAAPTTDPHRVRALLRETTQMRALRAASGALPWAGSQDVTELVERVRAEGAWLEGRSLVCVAQFAGACRRIARAVLAAAGVPDLARHAEGIPDLGEIEREILRCLTPEGEVRDDASEELLRLRRGIGRARREVVGALERMIGDAAHAASIQEPIVTLREDRYVIPVKSGGRGAVPGIVHDRSASGQTLFVEPQAVVELNNALREQVLAEREETLRILRSLAERVRRRAGELRAATAAMAALEAIWARAVYADGGGMVAPTILAGEGRLELLGARHPLLLASLGERTVPIDLGVGGETRTLVVTGPNTGGKTVVLKTAGLLCLMAQSGLHVPAEPGTGMSCFAAVLADIGDEQSIQQNLSTFSGHVKNVVAILDQAGPGTLVLLDELGAGTDPSEGAALGVAILEEVQQRGALTLATTHHNAVKVWAATTPGAMNAAMEFDESTLRPTYRLLAGIPGRSQAFAIAQRYGLDATVVARAREQRTVGEERFDRLMEELERERAAAASERLAAAAASAAIAAERRELEVEGAKQRRAWEDRRERLQRETRPVLREAEQELREQLRRLRETQNAEAADRVKVAARRLGELTATHLGRAEPAGAAPTAVAAGERVFVNALQAWGTASEAAAGQGSVTVVVGDKRITVPLAELSRRAESAASPGGRVERRTGRGRYAYTVPDLATTNLDLRGRRAEEALAALDRFLDAAVLNGLAAVSILHGKGTGKLQEAVREALGADRRVAAFAFAPPEQGGAGVTVVTLAG